MGCALGMVALMATPAKKPHKVPKQDVRYSKGMLTRHCSLCAYFIAPKRGKLGTCERVTGEIDPAYWCRLFERARGDAK